MAWRALQAPSLLTPRGKGDAAQFFDSIEDGQDWARKALQAGRFKYLALWGWASVGWELLEDFAAPTLKSS
jgi:hypothetical protein